MKNRKKAIGEEDVLNTRNGDEDIGGVDDLSAGENDEIKHI